MVQIILLLVAYSRIHCIANILCKPDGCTNFGRNNDDNYMYDYMIREAVRLAGKWNNPVCNETIPIETRSWLLQESGGLIEMLHSMLHSSNQSEGGEREYSTSALIGPYRDLQPATTVAVHNIHPSVDNT